MFRNILLATDGSAASTHAAQLAVDLARTHGATLTAVYVVDPYPYMGIGDTNPMGMNAYLAAAREHAAQAHARVAQLCGEAAPPVPLEARLVEHLSAAQGILETARAEHADLIVAGSRGRAGWESALLGSVATKLVQHAQLPVLIVP